MQPNLTKEERELLIKGLNALDTPAYNQRLRGEVGKLRTKLKNSLPK